MKSGKIAVSGNCKNGLVHVKKKKNFTKATENGNQLTEQQPQCDVSSGSRTTQ